MRRARLVDLTPSSVAAWQRRQLQARGGGVSKAQPKKQRRRRGRGTVSASTAATTDAPHARVACDTAVGQAAVLAPGTPPAEVAALAALPCGLSTVVADDSLVCSICTEVRLSLCAGVVSQPSRGAH